MIRLPACELSFMKDKIWIMIKVNNNDKEEEKPLFLTRETLSLEKYILRV